MPEQTVEEAETAWEDRSDHCSSSAVAESCVQANNYKKVYWRDYIAYCVGGVDALLCGCWQAVSHAPQYVRSRWRSWKHRIDQAQKSRADGKTSHERKIEAMRPENN